MNNIIRLFIVVLAVGPVVACKVPVHMAQSPFIFTYKQTYRLCSTKHSVDLVERLLRIQGNAVLRINDMEQAVVHGSIHVRIMPVPGDLSSFLIEGRGRHLLLGQIGSHGPLVYLGAGDYRIIDEGPYPLSALRHGFLTIRVRVFSLPAITQELATPRSKSDIFLGIFIRRIANDMYALDVDRLHPVGVRVDSDGLGNFIEVIGFAKFESPGDGRNLIDLRDIDRIKSDYAALMAGKLSVPRRSADVPTFEWLGERSCAEQVARSAP